MLQDFGARRQLLEHLLLGAAQDEGRDHPPQPQAHLHILIPFDGDREALVEVLPAAQQAGVDEAEEAPELTEVVFDGRARRDDAESAIEAEGRQRAFGAGVLDRLRLIQHDRLPGNVGERVAPGLHQAVAADHQVEGAEVVQHLLAIALTEQPHLQRGREAAGLVTPVQADRGGCDDQRRATHGAVKDRGEGLYGLAQSHVVGEAGAGTPGGQAAEPAIAVHLVVAQLGVQGRGQLRDELVRPLEPGEILVPVGVGVQRSRLPGDVIEGGRRQRVEAQTLPPDFAQHRHVLNAAAELLGEGQVLPIPDGDEAPGGKPRQTDQFRQVQGEFLVDGHIPRDAEPVPLPAHAEVQVLEAQHAADGQRLALRPLDVDIGRQGTQLQEQVEALLGRLHAPRPVGVGTRREGGTRVYHRLRPRLLRAEIPARLKPAAVHVCHHGGAAAGWDVGRPATTEGLHQQLDRQAVAGGQQVHVHRSIGVHLRRAHFDGADVGLHDQPRRQRRHGVPHSLPGPGGNREPPLEDRADAPMDLVQVDQAQPRRRVPQQQHFLRAAVSRNHGQLNRLAHGADDQFGFAADQFQTLPRRVLPEEQRVADHLAQRQIRTEAVLDRIGLPAVGTRGDGGADTMVLLGHAGRPLGQGIELAQGDAAPAGPGPLGGPVLLGRPQGGLYGVGVARFEEPDEPRLGGRFHGFGGRLRQRSERIQGPLPGLAENHTAHQPHHAAARPETLGIAPAVLAPSDRCQHRRGLACGPLVARLTPARPELFEACCRDGLRPHQEGADQFEQCQRIRGAGAGQRQLGRRALQCRAAQRRFDAAQALADVAPQRLGKRCGQVDMQPLEMGVRSRLQQRQQIEQATVAAVEGVRFRLLPSQVVQA